MTLSRITLESFDDELSGPTRVLSADYQTGFEAGAAEANETIAAQHVQALSDINATLADMAFGYAEARSELLDQVRPVLSQIAEAILPALAQETFATHVSDTLFRAFEDVTERAVQVAIAPDMAGILGGSETAFSTVSDPTLALGQARLQRGETHILIDLPALVTALQAALLGLEANQRTHSHG